MPPNPAPMNTAKYPITIAGSDPAGRMASTPTRGTPPCGCAGAAP